MLSNGEHERVLAAALEAVGRLMLNAHAAQVVDYLKHPSPPVRQNAVRALSQCVDAPIPTTALEHLSDPDPETRALMIRLLTTRGAPEAAQHIRPRLTDKNSGVRATAVIGLMTLNDPRSLIF